MGAALNCEMISGCALALQVVELMGAELGWSRGRMKAELQRAMAFLDTFDSERAQQEPSAAAAGAAAAAVGRG